MASAQRSLLSPNVRRWVVAAAFPVLVLLGFIGYFKLFPLAGLAKRIARADQVVASRYPYRVSLTVTGEDAARVIQAVSSAKRDMRRFGGTFMTRTRFLSGTNFLGDIQASSSDLFLAGDIQYSDRSDTVRRLVVAPLDKLEREAWENQPDAK
jgi:hypothetical protein